MNCLVWHSFEDNSMSIYMIFNHKNSDETSLSQIKVQEEPIMRSHTRPWHSILEVLVTQNLLSEELMRAIAAVSL